MCCLYFPLRASGPLWDVACVGVLLLLVFYAILPVRTRRVGGLASLGSFRTHLLRRTGGVRSVRDGFARVGCLSMFSRGVASGKGFCCGGDGGVYVSCTRPVGCLVIVGGGRLGVMSSKGGDVVSLRSGGVVGRVRSVLATYVINSLSGVSPNCTLRCFRSTRCCLVRVGPIDGTVRTCVGRVRVCLSGGSVSIRGLHLSRATAGCARCRFSSGGFGSLGSRTGFAVH